MVGLPMHPWRISLMAPVYVTSHNVGYNSLLYCLLEHAESQNKHCQNIVIGRLRLGEDNAVSRYAQGLK
jgi:hypothetical protein